VSTEGRYAEPYSHDPGVVSAVSFRFLRATGATTVEVRNPLRTTRLSERRHVTVMFCNLVDSTGIVAKLDAMGNFVRAYPGAALNGRRGTGTTLGHSLGKRVLADPARRLTGPIDG
jgi:hypothetical protein